MSNKDVKLIGTYVPNDISSYLSLYARAPGITKASLVRNIIINWVNEQKNTTYPTDELILEWRKKVELKWEAFQLSENNNTKDNIKNEFKGQWLNFLLNKGVSESDAKKIIGNLKI